MFRSLLAASALIFTAPAGAQCWKASSGRGPAEEMRTAVARTQAEWDALWARHPAVRPNTDSAADFSEEMVVVVFPGADCRMALRAALDPLDASRLVVFYRESSQGNADPAPPASASFALAKVPRAASVAFEPDMAVRGLDSGLLAAGVKLPALPEKLDAGHLNAAFDGAAPTPAVSAHPGKLKRFFGGEWYVSWGYNTETWSRTDIHVSQPSLGNDFTLHGVKGHDSPGWDTGILDKDLTSPQYNVRIGRFIDKKRTLAVELNYDHTKYTAADPQTVRLAGTVGGKPVDQNAELTGGNFRYHLHNGANHIMVNVVKRVPLVGRPNQSLSAAWIAKAGVGVMLPQSDNLILGQANDVGEKKFGNLFGKHHGWWQLDGWTAGVETGLRLVPLKPFYVELTDKVAYAGLSDIPVYQGTAKHGLWMNELILSLGVTFNGGPKHRRR